MKYLPAIVAFFLGLALTAYVGIVVLFVGGINEFIDGIDAHPHNTPKIVWGIVKVFPLTEVVSTAIMWVTLAVTSALGWKPLKRGLGLGR